MSDLEIGLLILLVVGIIASNLAVLKYSAKFKMTQFGKAHQIKQPTKQDAVAKDEMNQQQITGNNTSNHHNPNKTDNTDKE